MNCLFYAISFILQTWKECISYIESINCFYFNVRIWCFAMAVGFVHLFFRIPRNICNWCLHLKYYTSSVIQFREIEKWPLQRQLSNRQTSQLTDCILRIILHVALRQPCDFAARIAKSRVCFSNCVYYI